MAVGRVRDGASIPTDEIACREVSGWVARARTNLWRRLENGARSVNDARSLAPNDEALFNAASGHIAHRIETFEEAIEDFQDPSQEWRRLFSELLGTFFLVLVAAGGGMMGQAFPNTISRTAAVVAPGLMVMAIILFMGKVSGAHLNPAVSIAFALRGDFPWWRVPGYIVVQLGGAALAALVPPGGRPRLGVVRLELPGRATSRTATRSGWRWCSRSGSSA